jgi:hypothetical protein
MIVFAYVLSFDIAKDLIIVGSLGNSYEIGSILFMRKWCKDGSSSVAVRNVEYSVAGTCERKRKV